MRQESVKLDPVVAGTIARVRVRVRCNTSAGTSARYKHVESRHLTQPPSVDIHTHIQIGHLSTLEFAVYVWKNIREFYLRKHSTIIIIIR